MKVHRTKNPHSSTEVNTGKRVLSDRYDLNWKQSIQFKNKNNYAVSATHEIERTCVHIWYNFTLQPSDDIEVYGICGLLVERLQNNRWPQTRHQARTLS
jgi:hypothetical protein